MLMTKSVEIQDWFAFLKTKVLYKTDMQGYALNLVLTIKLSTSIQTVLNYVL